MRLDQSNRFGSNRLATILPSPAKQSAMSFKACPEWLFTFSQQMSRPLSSPAMVSISSLCATRLPPDFRMLRFAPTGKPFGERIDDI